MKLTLNRCQDDKTKQPAPSFEEDKELFEIIKDLEQKVMMENKKSVPANPSVSSSALLHQFKPPTTTYTNFD